MDDSPAVKIAMDKKKIEDAAAALDGLALAANRANLALAALFGSTETIVHVSPEGNEFPLAGPGNGFFKKFRS